MDRRKITSKSSEKIPSYVPIYNMLYSDILNGLYKDGSLLPSETVLTEKYGVSRNTLRQALTVLTEDGLIVKRQGKGTEVTYKKELDNNLDKTIKNPILHCAKEEIDEISISYNYGPPTEVAQRKLNIKATEIVMASNNVYLVKKKPVAHAFIQIPVKHIDNIEVDLNSEDEVSDLINKKMFERAATAKISIKLIFAEENVTEFLQIPLNTPILFLEEILYNEQLEGIARCKLYFIPSQYEISLNL